MPEYYHESAETVEIENALSIQVDKMQQTRDEFMQQLNVQTATWGLSLWEEMLGVPTNESENAEYRRSRILSKLRGQGTSTKEMLENMAAGFTNGKVTIVEYPEEYRFEVHFDGTTGIPPNMEDLTAALEEVKPAHLAYRYIYYYFTHQQISPYTHSQLHAYTHEQIRNGGITSESKNP